MARLQPSHPSTHTAAQLTHAFNAMRNQPKFTAAPPQARPRRPVGVMPTPEREARASGGLEYRPLSNNAGHVQPRVRSPWELTEERCNRIASELAKAPEPHYRSTRADLAFENNDGPLIKEALNSYLRDKITIARRTHHHDGVCIQTGSQLGKLPYTQEQGRAYRRLAIIEKNLSPRDLADLRELANMFAELDAGHERLSMEAFAAMKTGARDPKVREGIFIGIFWKVGERLYDVMNSHRASKELALKLVA